MASDVSYTSASQQRGAAEDASSTNPPDYDFRPWGYPPSNRPLSLPPSSPPFSPLTSPSRPPDRVIVPPPPASSSPPAKSGNWTKRWLIAAAAILLVIVCILSGFLASRANGGSTASPAGSASTSVSAGEGEPTVFGPTTYATPDPSSPSDRPTSSNPTPTSESRSVCQGRVCPSLLSAVKLPGSDPPRAFIFGRGKDSGVWYRETDGDKWLSEWVSLGGDMKSQPMATATRNGRVYVVGYANNETTQYKVFRGNKWSADWIHLGDAATSAPYIAGWGSDAVQVAIRGTQSESERVWLPNDHDPWSNWESRGGILSSSMVVTCTSDATLFRLAVFGYNGVLQPMFHNTWAASWSGWVNVGGDFRGNPAIATRNNEELLTFGITVNLTLQYNNWTRTGADKNQLFDLGGSFQSVPTILVMSTKRLDVLAVGTDDRLKHRALIGQTWAPDWQDLGGAFNSTPAAVSLNNDKVIVYGLGVDGAMFYGSWAVSNGFDWVGDGVLRSAGKSFSMESYDGY